MDRRLLLVLVEGRLGQLDSDAAAGHEQADGVGAHVDRERKLEIVSCPSCGRAQVDVYTLADDVTEGLKDMTVPLRVAVMGCVVNGPGEARDADLGVASGNGKGQIFVKGQVIKTVPESEIVATLIEEANRLADEMGPSAAPGTAQVITA